MSACSKFGVQRGVEGVFEGGEEGGGGAVRSRLYLRHGGYIIIQSRALMWRLGGSQRAGEKPF